VVAEDSETPGGEPGRGSSEGIGFGGLGRRGEGDLLAERRARRAAESGKDALLHRAEAAEATMQTLQAHVVSLQGRLRETEEERERLKELLARGRPSEAWAAEAAGERELRHVKQREYAEQQLRADAEERLRDVEAAARAEVQRVRRLLAIREREAQTLARELDGVRRELAEAEQAAATEHAALRRVERDLHGRLAEVERRKRTVDRELHAERGARERSERMLQSIARGHRLMQGVVGELRDLLARLTAAFAADAEVRPAAPADAGEPPAPSPGAQSGASRQAGSAREELAATLPAGEDMAEALAAAVARLRARADETATGGGERVEPRKPHHHSMSLIGRWRAALRRRRQARRRPPRISL